MKFIFGVFVGLLMGILFIISMSISFIGGLWLGWKAFGEDEKPITTPEEVPVT